MSPRHTVIMILISSACLLLGGAVVSRVKRIGKLRLVRVYLLGGKGKAETGQQKS